MSLKGTFNPENDVPNLTSKVIIITGGTTGLGKHTVLEFAKHCPSHVFLTGRNAEAANSTIQHATTLSPSTKFSFVACDHTSLSSVQSAAKQILESAPRIDILVCNAGIMGGPPSVTEDGYEVQFSINYLAHALLIKMILPTLDRTAIEYGDARIVLVASNGFKLVPKEGIVFKELNTTQENLGMGSKWLRYGQSKLAMVLYGKQLAKRYPNITTSSIHPGVIHTGLINDLPFGDRMFIKAVTFGKEVPAVEGTYNALWASTADKAGFQSGGIYEPVGKPFSETKLSQSQELQGALWKWTEEQLGSYN